MPPVIFSVGKHMWIIVLQLFQQITLNDSFHISIVSTETFSSPVLLKIMELYVT